MRERNEFAVFFVNWVVFDGGVEVAVSEQLRVRLVPRVDEFDETRAVLQKLLPDQTVSVNANQKIGVGDQPNLLLQRQKLELRAPHIHEAGNTFRDGNNFGNVGQLPRFAAAIDDRDAVLFALALFGVLLPLRAEQARHLRVGVLAGLAAVDVLDVELVDDSGFVARAFLRRAAAVLGMNAPRVVREDLVHGPVRISIEGELLSFAPLVVFGNVERKGMAELDVAVAALVALSSSDVKINIWLLLLLLIPIIIIIIFV